VDGKSVSLSLGYRPGATLVEAEVDGQPVTLRIARKRNAMTITHAGRARTVQVMAPRVAALRRHMIEKIPPDMSKFLVSPMPGLLTRLLVKLGDKVEAGQPLATVEAMKMENMLRAEKSAVVAKVAAGEGESLAIDQVILEFE
jgi:propionyl-CoA carboxylase alpha chain